jgi:hypothetical protein
MKRNFHNVPVVALCLLTAAVLTAFASDRSAVGTWKLDTNKSSYGSLPTPKFEELVITSDTADSLAWKLTGAGADGTTFTLSFDGPTDGTFHPIVGSRGEHEIAYTRIPGGGVKFSVRTKSGYVFSSGESHLSADGNTMTRRGTVQGPDGKGDFVSVYTRVEP